MHKINKNITLLAVFLGLCSASMGAFATGSGFYMGLQVGYANLNNEAANINTGVPDGVPIPPPLAENALVCAHEFGFAIGCQVADNVTPSNKGIAGRFYMGANINEYIGLEAGASAYTPSEYSPDVSGSHQPHVWEYSADFLGKAMYPFGPFSIFAKGGLGIVYRSATAAILGDDESNSASYFAVPAYGIGAAYDFTPNWQVDFSTLRYQGSGNLKNIDFVAVSVSYHFVQEYCGQFLC